MGLSIKQRVKVNAALSMIHAQGYDAQTVVGWAKEYQREGYDGRRAMQRALNEFIAGQPELGDSISKITRLVEASDGASVAKYDTALSSYIATGDDSALVALAPMMAADSVALALKNGEIKDGSLTGESVEAALGFAMADDLVTQAATLPAPQEGAEQAPQGAPEGATRSTFGFNTASVQKQGDRTASQLSAAPDEGRIANQARWDAAPRVGVIGAARTLLGGARRGDTGLGDISSDPAISRADIIANYANQGAVIPAETI